MNYFSEQFANMDYLMAMFTNLRPNKYKNIRERREPNSLK